jgi:hypothetical protein
MGLAWSADQRNPSPLGRHLLVASEGLYMVEADGRASWSYQPAPERQPFRGMEDDLIYDGWVLSNGHYLYSTHRYVREIDAAKRTLWEYRVTAPAEVKSGVPLPNGRIGVLHSQEQAILEIEPGTGKVLHRIAVPAKGNDHTRYMLVRATPQGTFLVALREEARIVEVDSSGTVLHSLALPKMPVMALRLTDGSTVASGAFGLLKLNREWKEVWRYSSGANDLGFPLLIGWGILESPDRGLIVVNSDWHLPREGDNRVQVFALDPSNQVTWALSTTELGDWKHSDREPRTGLVEHRIVVVRPLSDHRRPK